MRRLIFLLPLLLAACAAPRPPAASEPVTYTVTDLDARGEGEHFTFYSLRENRVVPVADSASADWDLAFRSTTILANGGASGPGEGAVAVLQDTTFAAVTAAPADDAFVQDRGTDKTETAIPGGAGNGWYDYDFVSGIVAPRPAVLVVRTADGRYAKVEVLSYYQGAPSMDEIDPTEGFRHYTFRVRKSANKLEIRKAIEERYPDVTVKEVRTMVVRGKRRRQATRRGLLQGRQAAWKKAVVTLADGEIDFYESV